MVLRKENTCFDDLSGNLDIAALLVEAGAKVNHVNSYKQTALHMAVEQASKKAYHLLLSLGADESIKVLILILAPIPS